MWFEKYTQKSWELLFFNQNFNLDTCRFICSWKKQYINSPWNLCPGSPSGKCLVNMIVYVITMKVLTLKWITNLTQISSVLYFTCVWVFVNQNVHFDSIQIVYRCHSQDSVAQMVKNLPAMQDTQVRSLGRKDPLVKGTATHFSILAWRMNPMDRGAWWATVHGAIKNQTWLSN